MLGTAHVPVGSTPDPLPQFTSVPPASRRVAPWTTDAITKMFERLTPGFWSDAVYGTLAPSMTGVNELALTPAIVSVFGMIVTNTDFVSWKYPVESSRDTVKNA